MPSLLSRLSGRQRALIGVAVFAGACGAAAIGALAIGSLAVGALAVGRARIGRLEIGELVVGRITVQPDGAGARTRSHGAGRRPRRRAAESPA